MDKKTIILVGLLVVVLIFWGQITQYLGLVDPPPPPPPVTQTQSDSVSGPAATTQTPPAQATPQYDSAAAVADISPATDSLVPEQIILVRTPHYQLEFTNRGGGINKIVLNDYTYVDNGNLIMTESQTDVVPDFQTAGGGWRASHLSFTTGQTDFEINSGDNPRKITYTYDNQLGGRLIKTYIINPDNFDIDFKIEVEGIENFGFERYYRLVWGITPAPTETNLKDDFGYFKVVAMMSGDNLELGDFDNGRLNEDLPGPTTWAGLRTKYFAAVMIPRSRGGDGVIATGTEQQIIVDGDKVTARDFSVALNMPIPNYGNVADSFTLYVGPIDYKTLKGYDLGLQDLTSLGWKYIIKPFSIAIIWLLPKIYNVIPNYGIVVLIFALLIKLLTFPLSRKQALAMSKMKDLQPKMKALQEKYKNDAARLNKEMMKLYKQAGANPLSGCLPMLPQMPLFFALFTVFKTTIEFRGAGFFWWITDLSVPDPLYILPIIMTVSMFFQQKMTMTDPKNKMMVYLMPLFFGWLFMNFPAGLVLYWTGFNILSFVETIYVRNKQQQNPDVQDPE